MEATGACFVKSIAVSWETACTISARAALTRELNSMAEMLTIVYVLIWRMEFRDLVPAIICFILGDLYLSTQTSNGFSLGQWVYFNIARDAMEYILIYIGCRGMSYYYRLAFWEFQREAEKSTELSKKAQALSNANETLQKDVSLGAVVLLVLIVSYARI